jgi:threonylcarbamoyladenosine tRNA methylthiotransferase MtaB
VIVNSCTVTAAAAHKTRQALHAARRRMPAAFIVVAGCSATIDADRLTADGTADLIVPTAAKAELVSLLPADVRVRPARPCVVTARAASGPFTIPTAGRRLTRTRHVLKVQEGCDYRCSYCVVPDARGLPRSRQWEDVLAEARERIADGVHELVLSGVNLACYRDGDRTIADLVAALTELAGDFRIRLSSVEPGPVLPALIRVMSERRARVCRFLHLPLQYGEDSILRRMNRRYSVEEYAAAARQAVDAIPDLCLGTDLMVGFPGETEETFRACCQTVAGLPFAYLHVFRFSPRPGTAAAEFGDRVPASVVARRFRELTAIGTDKATEYARSQIGHRLSVLTETRGRSGRWEGWSDNYLRVELAPDGAPAEANRVVTALPVSVLGPRRVLARIESPSPAR